MRSTCLLVMICYSCVNYGQDSLQVATSSALDTDKISSIGISDTALFKSKDTPILTPAKGKVVAVKSKIKAPIIRQKESANEVDKNDNGYPVLFIVVLVIAFIVGFKFYRLLFDTLDIDDIDRSREDDYLVDQLGRILLPRKAYYRNVYLKSEAWKRKRYLVLKRDNWRCVYCGGKATQVHHTRYAKRNIGKEPIEWLVSICNTCHEAKH